MLILAAMLALQEYSEEIRGLSSDDPEARTKAAEALIKAGIKAAPAVAPLLESEDAEVSAQAERILKAVGLPAVAHLTTVKGPRAAAVADAILIERAAAHLKPRDLAVEWGAAGIWEAAAESEFGGGSGHGSTLRWIRMRPVKEGVEVLSIELEGNRKSYSTPQPPDEPAVKVKRGTAASASYGVLLRLLATIDAAKLAKRPDKRGTFWSSSSDFWVSVRVRSGDRAIAEGQYAGYRGSSGEPTYAKPSAALSAVNEWIGSVEMKDQEPTADERAWVSAKFARDWGTFTEHDFWWVRERYLQLLGRAGDTASYAALRKVIEGGEKRELYYAINAAARLLGKDAGASAEDADLEPARKRVLELLPK